MFESGTKVRVKCYRPGELGPEETGESVAGTILAVGAMADGRTCYLVALRDQKRTLWADDAMLEAEKE